VERKKKRAGPSTRRGGLGKRGEEKKRKKESLRIKGRKRREPAAAPREKKCGEPWKRNKTGEKEGKKKGEAVSSVVKGGVVREKEGETGERARRRKKKKHSPPSL